MSEKVTLNQADQAARILWTRLPKNLKPKVGEEAGRLFDFLEQLQDLVEEDDWLAERLPEWLTGSE